MRSARAFCFTVLVTAALAIPARGEVAAKTDQAGGYVCMVYRYSTYDGAARIWSPAGLQVGRVALNPWGDRSGDLAPTVAENQARRNWPLVVWSRPSDGTLDLVFSAWNGRGWNPARYVQTSNGFNDLEPRLAFNLQGQAFMVWWTDEGGTGAVYFSALGDSSWLPAFRVSAVGIDSRHPSLSVQTDSTLRVTYETPQGGVARSVTIARGDTITDDIDPKLQITVSVSD